MDRGNGCSTGFMDSFYLAFVTWRPLNFYPATDAPNFRKGYIASLVTRFLTIPLILVFAYLESQDRTKGQIGRVFDKGTEETAGSGSEGGNVTAIDIERQAIDKQNC